MAQQNGMQRFGGDWWQQVLGQYEPAQYYSSPTGMAFGQQAPAQQRYFQNSYQDILKDYYGQAGQQMRAGQAPTSFMDFLEADNPWTARYAQLPQTARGVTGMATNPRTRFLFNY